MQYQPGTIPAVQSATVAGVLTLAADIYALDPDSLDAIAEAAECIDWAHDLIERRTLCQAKAEARRANTVRTAKVIAATLATARTAPAAQVQTWERIQATTPELWPILADAANRAARTEGIYPRPAVGRWLI